MNDFGRTNSPAAFFEPSTKDERPEGRWNTWWKAARRIWARETADVSRARLFLDEWLPPVLSSCGVDPWSKLGNLVRASWECIAAETADARSPASHELWAKKVLYVHRRGSLRPCSKDSDDENACLEKVRFWRIGVTDDPKKRNAVKRSEGSGYEPFFQVAVPLCDMAEASLQTLLLPFAQRHATNRRASCFRLPDRLGILVCEFVHGFYASLLGEAFGSPCSAPCPTTVPGGAVVHADILGNDAREAYFRSSKCQVASCDSQVPLFRSRRWCPLHSRLRRVEQQMQSLKSRTSRAREKLKKLRFLERRLSRKLLDRS